jgi:His/Glu/Gln/Arg/opine family amino acid ABC transporter permease subunit
MVYYFDWQFILRSMPELLNGLKLTFAISGAAIPLAMVWGLVVSLLRVSPNRVLSRAATAYIELLRNTPGLCQLYFIFFALPFIGVFLSPFLAGVVALTAQHGAFFSEIYRAGIDGIAKGQIEAGKAIGMRYATVMREIVLPQAIILVIPPMVSQLTILFLDSSLVSTVGVVELTLAGKKLAESRAASYEVFATIGVMYLIVTLLFGLTARTAEARLRFVH